MMAECESQIAETECNPQESEVAQLQAEIAALRAELKALREQWDEELDHIFREIASDRQRISRLENPEDGEPTRTELGHLKRIEKHLIESSMHSASFAELRGILGVSPGRISQLIKKLDPQRFEVRRSVANHRGKILVLRRRSL
jgi:DNA-directed RNA polymerase specialized sigma subunit